MEPWRPRLRISFLLAALLLGACSPQTARTTATPSPTGDSASPGSNPTVSASPTPSIDVDPQALRGVTIQVWQAFAGAAAGVFIDQVAQFNLSNEWGIQVVPGNYSDYITLFETVEQAAAAGSAPDMLAALPEQILAWNDSSLLLDLTPYMGDPAWGMGAELNDMPEVFLAQDAVEGKQLGLPAQRSARFIYYNQSWARELGFNEPPATAEEFRQQACAANASFRSDTSPQNDGYGGWYMDTNWQSIYAWMLAFGGGVVNAGEYTFRTEPNLDALQFLKGLYDDHCAWFSNDLGALESFNRRLALFANGDLAEVALETQAMARVNNTDEWTLIPYPGSQGSALVVHGPSYSVFKSTPERQLAAWLFMRWILSPTRQAGWVDAYGLFPLGPTEMTVAPSPQWQAAVAGLSVAQGLPQLVSWQKARYLLQDGATFIFQTPIPLDQIPEILNEMDATAKEIEGK